MKTIVRALLPPLAIWIAEETKRRRIWSRGKYSWPDARAAAGTYDDNLVNEFRAKRSAMARASGIYPDVTNHLLANVIRLLGGAVEVTNFGGATADLDLALKRQFPNSSFTVVENPTLVALMPGDLGVKFTTQLPSSCDIFYSSGTIQYVEDAYRVLDAAFEISRLAVILTRNVFGPHSVLRVQRSRLFDNGSGPIPPNYKNVRIGYPHKEMHLREIKEKASSYGFSLLCEIPTPSTTLPPHSYSADIVFLRQCSAHQS